MRRDRENLDETIDRVAGTMTYVASDPALAARIAQRVERDAPRARGWTRLGLAAAGVAAVALLAVMTSTNRHAPEDRRMVAANPPAAVTAPVAVSQAAAPAGQVATTAQQAAPARRRRTITHISEVPQIDPLSSPVLLAVDSIPSDVLTVAPVDLAPLDLANLALTETDGPNDPKE